MTILKSITPKEFPRFVELFESYQRDLLPYNSCLQEKDINKENIRQNYVEDSALAKFWIEDNGDIVGFIVLQHVNKPYVERPLWYIVEFYIVPEYRRQNIGTRAFEVFLKNFRGDFFYYVLGKNIPAQKFWAKMTDIYNLDEVKRPDIKEEDECNKHCFKR